MLHKKSTEYNSCVWCSCTSQVLWFFLLIQMAILPTCHHLLNSSNLPHILSSITDWTRIFDVTQINQCDYGRKSVSPSSVTSSCFAVFTSDGKPTSSLGNAHHEWPQTGAKIGIRISIEISGGSAHCCTNGLSEWWWGCWWETYHIAIICHKLSIHVCCQLQQSSHGRNLRLLWLWVLQGIICHSNQVGI